MAILVTVQGNIGSGKSTRRAPGERFQGNKSVCFLQEPLDIWNTVTMAWYSNANTLLR